MYKYNPINSAFRLAHALKQTIDHQIDCQCLDISPMNVRVMKIIEANSPCTAQDIAKYLKRDKAQVTRLINSLVEKGIIGREANPHDKRSQLLVVMEPGREMMSLIEGIDQEILKKFQGDVTEEELETFKRLASKMATVLETSV